MSVHWHGGPIWGDRITPSNDLIKALYRNGCSLISFARPDQIKKIAAIDCKLVLDNGAFSTWRKASSGICQPDAEWWRKHWNGYYYFVGAWFSRIEWFIIPDVIEGSEAENDNLIGQVPHWLMDKAVPVWHSDESIERLLRLCQRFPRVAIGCCGPHRIIRTKPWQQRMDEVFRELYVIRKLRVKIHGLRMLDVRVLSRYPFASADSTNVAVNVPLTEKRFPEIKDKLTRTAVMRAAIERVFPPTVSDWVATQPPMQRPIILASPPTIKKNGAKPLMTELAVNPYCVALDALRAQPTHKLKEVGDQWRSPEAIWWGINAMFGPFVLDLFADASNAKCEAFYSAEDNALTQDWSARLSELRGAAYANPPYSRASQQDGQYITGMTHIMAHTAAMRELGGRYVFLIKAATGELWWPEDADHIAFIRGRISFDLPVWYRPAEGQPSESSAGFGAAIAVFDKTWHGPKFDYVSRDELEARGAAFMRQIELAAARFQPQTQQQNIPEIIPALSVPETEHDVWPAEVKLMANQVEDLPDLSPPHHRKVMQHINRMLLEKTPPAAIIQAAKTLKNLLQVTS